jgi:hypothetical protein
MDVPGIFAPQGQYPLAIPAGLRKAYTALVEKYRKVMFSRNSWLDLKRIAQR